MRTANRYDEDGVCALVLAILSEDFIDGNTAYYKVTGRTLDKTLQRDFWTSNERDLLMALTNSGLSVTEVAERMGVSYRKIVERKTYLKRRGKWDSSITLPNIS